MAGLPMPGLRSMSYSGRPVTGSMLVNTFCFTYGFASMNEMPVALRSSIQR